MLCTPQATYPRWPLCLLTRDNITQQSDKELFFPGDAVENEIDPRIASFWSSRSMFACLRNDVSSILLHSFIIYLRSDIFQYLSDTGSQVLAVH
jgi:hypothetical protein